MVIVEFFSHKDNLEYGSDARAAAYLVGHVGFFVFNFVNFFYLLLVEGYIFGRLATNCLAKLAVIGCIFQLFSCFTSIYRYNINDEFSFAGEMGVWLAAVGFTVHNYLVSHFAFPFRPKYRTATLYGWIAISVVTCVKTHLDWDVSDFKYFRGYVGASVSFQFVCYYLARRSIKTGSVTSIENGSKLFEVAMLMCIVDMAMMMSKRPAFQYPGTGIGYTAVVLTAILGAGFVTASGPSTGGERESLNV
uniref:Uncharacterized protein n=1 Tax=Ditylum brightwellii TaxID=49249 RepID=A0A7S4SU76_9STRA|mmetsp:Transcript_40562/g.61506  ORF Transcript_40562/g.61506 Transcript_40562/m.61506 type:complete len:248 (+) Transcript_40562:79-822(+)